MTDDSEAERNAFHAVWPESELLLCRFHLSQAVWRWLVKRNHNVEKEDCVEIYKSRTQTTAFQQDVDYTSSLLIIGSSTVRSVFNEEMKLHSH